MFDNEETDMPTALPLAFRKADALLEGNADLGIANNGDLAIVAALTAIGLALTMGLAALFPQAANAVALALIVT
jgi:hypothetical protein